MITGFFFHVGQFLYVANQFEFRVHFEVIRTTSYRHMSTNFTGGTCVLLYI